MSTVICRTCGVEHAEQVSVCAICEDERQWVPAGGQAWMSLEEMRAAEYAVHVDAIEPGLLGIRSTPAVGIGQQSKLLQTPAGNLLWDPIGYVDDEAVRRVLAFGRVAAISSSHPHMFGAQVEWSRALDDAPVYVCAPNRPWVGRPDPVIRASIRAAGRHAHPLLPAEQDPVGDRSAPAGGLGQRHHLHPHPTRRQLYQMGTSPAAGVAIYRYSLRPTR